jgi:asparagine synthase (glutamine-hydrolysing)
MCGLAGAIGTAAGRREPTAAAWERAAEALARRGPDARHVWREGPCTLLHCRLRIIDLAERADQPMAADGGDRVVMIFNGEIYNFRALRGELEAAGWAFGTASDAEVFLTGYRAWGRDVFRRARGMWAVAFWHPGSQRLVLSRDPMGKKPLVYHASAAGLVFASTVSALLPLLEAVPPVDRSAIDCFLGHLVVPFEHSPFEGVTKVPPGSVVTWSPGAGATTERFWASPDGPGAVTAADAAVEVERLLRQAVRRRLESDVPLGVFLSAGFDSGLVAALAAQESGRSLVAVTAGTLGSGYDERDLAAVIARRYGLQHRALEVPAVSAAALPALIAELGEPFGDASLLPSYEVARAARREITVALTGDGGDEGFFGYDQFRAARYTAPYRRWVPGAVRRLLRERTRSVTRAGWLRRAAALFDYGAGAFAESYRNRMGFSDEERGRLLREGGGANGHRAEHVYAERLRRWSGLPESDALRRTFFETYLPNAYLTKVDTATMAASLEARCPFLDIDLVEFTLGLPADIAFPRGRLKALLRPLARRHLPPAVLEQPKRGFGIPVGEWARGELSEAFEEFVYRPGTFMASLIDTTSARAFHQAHARGADHSTRLWALLALGVWCAVVVERRWPAADPLPVGVPRRR